MSASLTTTDVGSIMESVIVKGDLSKLSPDERSTYYMKVCQSIGLNPLTRPMEYITLNGRLTLYARRDAADQLRKIHGISVEIVSKSIQDGLVTIHVRAKDGQGRTDEDYGVVSIAGLKGDAAANAFLKAITKAKRRVTLSISGLGWLDETEIESIPDAAKSKAFELIDDEIPESAEHTHDEIDAELSAAAELGMNVLELKWRTLTKEEQETFKQALTRRYKPQAQQADAERENATDIVKQCAMRCNDPRFHKFLEETNTAWGIMKEGTPTERAAELVRAIVGVKSRKDLATNSEAAEHWHDLEGRFQAWLRA